MCLSQANSNDNRQEWESGPSIRDRWVRRERLSKELVVIAGERVGEKHLFA